MPKVLRLRARASSEKATECMIAMKKKILIVC